MARTGARKAGQYLGKIIMSDDIEISVWVKRGMMLIRRDALDYDDPDHPYNFIKAQGLEPELYGYSKPNYIKCPECGHIIT